MGEAVGQTGVRGSFDAGFDDPEHAVVIFGDLGFTNPEHAVVIYDILGFCCPTLGVR